MKGMKRMLGGGKSEKKLSPGMPTCRELVSHKLVSCLWQHCPEQSFLQEEV